jgi:hypothetical protein
VRQDVSEQVGVVVRLHALQHRAHPLEAGAGVDRRRRQRGQRAVGLLALELHEHQVPDLEPALPRSRVGVGQARRAVHVVVDLGARAARADVAGRPEVVLLAQADDAVVAEAGDLAPQRAGLVVGAELALAAEHRDHQAVRVEAIDAGQELPGPGDRVGLEVVAEREVAEHLEERVVARRLADLVEVVLLAPGAHALLAGGGAGVAAGLAAGEDVLELDHPGDREQERRIVGGHQRARGHPGVAARRRSRGTSPSRPPPSRSAPRRRGRT